MSVSASLYPQVLYGRRVKIDLYVAVPLRSHDIIGQNKDLSPLGVTVSAPRNISVSKPLSGEIHPSKMKLARREKAAHAKLTSLGTAAQVVYPREQNRKFVLYHTQPKKIVSIDINIYVTIKEKSMGVP